MSPRRLLAATAAGLIAVGLSLSGGTPVQAGAPAKSEPVLQAARLHIVKIHCIDRNDFVGSDEPYINLNGQRLWSGSNVDIGDEESVELWYDFNDLVTMTLMEDDGGAAGDDDKMGEWYVFSGEAGSGVKFVYSQWTDGYYSVWYEVV